MKRHIFLKSALVLLMIVLFFSSFIKKSKTEKVGWELGVQSYTFHKFSFCEAVDKVHQLGLKNIEVYFGQSLGGGIEGTMDFKMDKATQKKVFFS